MSSSQQPNGSWPPEWLIERLGARQVDIGFNSFLCQRQINIAPDEARYLESALSLWTSTFPGHNPNFMRHAYGVSSPIVRIDYVMHEKDGTRTPFIYEVEDRPGGMATTALLNPACGDMMAECLLALEKDTGKNVAFCLSDARVDTSDDRLFYEEYMRPRMGQRRFHVGIPEEADRDRHLWWVRSEDEEDGYEDLNPFAISTIYPIEGDKSYGIGMGLWKEIPDDRDTLPWDQGFVLKPGRGSRFSVSITQKGERAKRNGCDTRTKAETGITEGRFKFWQPYVPHESHGFLTQPADIPPTVREYSLLRRVTFVYDIPTRQFKCAGGIWCTVPGVRGHGRPDAIFGPAIC